MNIDEMNLSVRTYNCLIRAGIRTVEELRVMGSDRIKNIRNIGKKGCNEIESKLSAIKKEENLPGQMDMKEFIGD